MTAVGGPLQEVSISGRVFPVAADVEAERTLGGVENEVESNGDGGARLLKTVAPLMMENIPLVIDDDKADHEFLQGEANKNDFLTCTFTYVSGAIWQSLAQLTGELKANAKTAVMPVTFKGPGILTNQQ